MQYYSLKLAFPRLRYFLLFCVIFMISLSMWFYNLSSLLQSQPLGDRSSNSAAPQAQATPSKCIASTFGDESSL